MPCNAVPNNEVYNKGKRKTGPCTSQPAPLFLAINPLFSCHALQAFFSGNKIQQFTYSALFVMLCQDNYEFYFNFKTCKNLS